MKGKVLLLLIFVFHFLLINVYAEEVLDGVVTRDNSIFYYKNNQMVKNFWLDVDDDGKNDYYFDDNGKAVDGVQKIDNVWYYFIANIKQYEATDGVYYYGRLSGSRQYNYWWDKDRDGKNDYYFADDGKIVDGVKKIDGLWYYFVDTKKQYEATDGTYYYGRLSGSRQYNYWWDKDHDGKNDYFFGDSGKQVKSGWYDFDKDEKMDYYFDDDGKIVDGVKKIDGLWYYFVDTKKQYEATDGTYYYGRLSGSRQYNYWWDKDHDGKNDYYFDDDGKIVDGVKEIDGLWYYFVDTKKQYEATDGTYYYGRLSGSRQYNYWWDKDHDGKNDYYFDDDGKIVDGVKKIDGLWYYFVDTKKQYEATDGTYYYGRLSGSRQYNYWWDKDHDGKNDYYFADDGKQIKSGWHDFNKDGKMDYYFNSESKAVDGIQKIGDIWYYFVNNRKQYEATDGTYYYGRLSGSRQYNYWWDKDHDGKNDYYFGSDGIMVKGSQNIDNVYFYFDENGKKLYGIFIVIDGKKYYYGKLSGARQYGWIYHGDKIYYFDEETGEMATGSVNINGIDYKFNTDGTWQAGWMVDNGNRYYYYLNGTKAVGWVTIAGIKCYFNEFGVLIQEGALKVIDVSSHQGLIDWNKVKTTTDVDAAILRVGYGTSYTTDAPVLDAYFQTNYNSVVRLNLLHGVYIYSYAINAVSANIEANFVIDLLNKNNYDKNKIVYYDLEENPWTVNLSHNDYDIIIRTFVNRLEQAGYKVQVYTYKYMAENKFSDYARSKLGWIAQYYNTCTYRSNYYGWQYTSNGSVNGVSGDVDISVFKK